MKSLPCGLGSIALVLLALSSPASAQYMYLDSNGDGVHTAADVLHAVGPTVVDIWLDSNHNRDGTVATCSESPVTPMNIFSYILGLGVSDGTVSFSPYTNRVAQMFSLPPAPTSDGTRLYMGGFGMPPGTTLPPGKYLLGTVTVSVTSGTPSILFLAGTTPGTDMTAFGSNCTSPAFGNTITLGIDFLDADGLAYGTGGGPNQAPVLSPVSDMTVPSGENLTQPIVASDAEGQPLTFSKSSGPPFMFVGTTDVGSGTAHGEIRLAPFASDIGSGTGNVSVTDGAATDQAAFQIVVSRGPNHQPFVAPIPRLSVIAGRVGKTFLSAGDPDGDALHITKTSGPAFVSVRELAARNGGASAVLTASPTLCDAGSATAVVSITDGVAQTHQEVALIVIPPSAPPDATLRNSTFPSTLYSREIALGDLNRDGNVDVVLTHDGPASITVLLGQGDGNFVSPASYPIETWSLGLTIADLNGDGILDVAVANSVGNSVSVLLGRGDGTLVPQIPYETGHGPQGIAAADMNHDGKSDLVTCNYGSGTVSVLLGAGDGTFGTRRDSPLGSNPSALVVQDFNLDGRPDVVVSHARPGGSGPVLAMLPGLGDGTFGEPIPAATTGYALSITSADWNGDGLPDVALPDYDPGKILVFYGHGDGTFSEPTTPALLSRGWGIAAADLNGDGTMDLAATDPDEFRVVALFGDGGGGFTSPAFLPGLGATGSFALGDVNSDGRPDFLSSDNGVAAALNRFAPGAPPAEARAFVLGGHRTVPSSAGAGSLCVQVEPANRSYTNDLVDLTSFTLRSEGTGSVSEVHCIAPRKNVVADTDANGVPEIAAFFSRSDLAALFDKLHGRTAVTAQLTGSLTDARPFCTGIELNVVGTGEPPRTASFSPNPLNPRSKLTFSTVREGPAKALLFDIQGRLVRTLLDTPQLAAGPHEYFFDGTNDRGRTLSSGVYFYRVQSIEGVFDGQIVILK